MFWRFETLFILIAHSSLSTLSAGLEAPYYFRDDYGEDIYYKEEQNEYDKNVAEHCAEASRRTMR